MGHNEKKMSKRNVCDVYTFRVLQRGHLSYSLVVHLIFLHTILQSDLEMS